MDKNIVITGASKGIGRAAADALSQHGWSIIGIARTAPAQFPGVFIESDLSDARATQALASRLAARRDVLGIVNNVGLVKHETIGAVDPSAFSVIMDLNLRPALQLNSGAPARHACGEVRTHCQHHEPSDPRSPGSH